MAGVWYDPTAAQAQFRFAHSVPHKEHDTSHTYFKKSKLSVLLERVVNMSNCSKSSRALLATLRSQMNLALDQRGLLAGGDTSQQLASSSKTKSPPAQFDCEHCKGFMVQPVCLPCGHSVCKSCMHNLPKSCINVQSLVCPRCSATFPKVPSAIALAEALAPPPGDGRRHSVSDNSVEQHQKPTLILQNVLRKWYPIFVESCKYREEGNQFANEGDYPLAIHWYTKAIETGVIDHRVLSNRARAYLAIDQLNDALADAETSCELRPFWAKGHYRRAAVLEKQGKWYEALAAYLLCLEFECNDQSVVKKACQLIDSNMSAFLSMAETFLHHHQVHPSPPPSLPPTDGTMDTTPPSSSNSLQTLASIVQLSVDVMMKCVSTHHTCTTERVTPDLIMASDFECALCTGLLYSPVTTACGHSFCQCCLSRSFDHSPSCPICRSVLAENFEQHCQNSGKMSIDVTLDSILSHYFRDAYEEKKTQMEAELLRKSRVGISEQEELPVFVCTIAYPGIACPMHIFEPRYRLMLRRCVESGSRRFGMCQLAADEESLGNDISFSEYGTVLYVNSMENTPDGRSLITTTGERRFRCLRKGKVDGYQVAAIMFLFDERITDPDEIANLRALQREIYNHAYRWLNALPLYPRLRIMQTACSPLPSIDPVPECCPNGPTWVWWFVHALPTTPQKKLNFLKCTSLRERLLMLKDALPIPA